MRQRIAQTLVDIGYSELGVNKKLPRVANLDKDGVDIFGNFPGRYSREKGLVIWNNSARYGGSSMSVSDLAKVESALRELHEEFIPFL